MNKETIYNTYAKEQGYESWDNLVNEKINEQRLSLYYDFNAVTDLIQEELKKKIHDKVMNNDISFVIDELGILNTEIL